MVSFDICAGNPGALTFLMQAYDVNMFRAERGFQRMQDNGITGSRLYMLWNDCCDRDTELALWAMENMAVSEIVRHINYEGGRGLPIEKEKVNWWARAPVDYGGYGPARYVLDAEGKRREEAKRRGPNGGPFLL